jgi:hypothetical protein
MSRHALHDVTIIKMHLLQNICETRWEALLMTFVNNHNAKAHLMQWQQLRIAEYDLPLVLQLQQLDAALWYVVTWATPAGRAKPLQQATSKRAVCEKAANKNSCLHAD